MESIYDIQAMETKKLETCLEMLNCVQSFFSFQAIFQIKMNTFSFSCFFLLLVTAPAKLPFRPSLSNQNNPVNILETAFFFGQNKAKNIFCKEG